MGFPLVKANLVVALMKDSLPHPASQEVPRVQRRSSNPHQAQEAMWLFGECPESWAREGADISGVPVSWAIAEYLGLVTHVLQCTSSPIWASSY